MADACIMNAFQRSLLLSLTFSFHPLGLSCTYILLTEMYFSEFRPTSTETDTFIAASQVSSQHGQVSKKKFDLSHTFSLEV